MIRKLLIVFASGLALSIALLSAAWVIGGEELLRRAPTDFGGWTIGHDHRHHHGRTESRTLDFDAGKVLTIDAPVTLRFTRGTETRMTVEGPGRMVERLNWHDGTLSSERKGRWFGAPLEVTITAPQLAGLVLHGASDVALIALDQPSLAIDAHGAVDLEASGKVGRVTVTSRGAGDIDLERLEATDAAIDIGGVGDVDVNASGNVDAAISGAGDITLHRKPATLNSRINGFGSVHHDY